MNSLQMSDLAGTNVRNGGGGDTTSLYFTTQDNQLYASANGGGTWKVGHGSEGFGLESRHDAAAGKPAQFGFVAINGQGDMFAELDAVNVRTVPALDENGASLTGFQYPFFVSQQTGTGQSNWIRRRIQGTTPVTEMYFSNNSGGNWRKFGTVNFKAGARCERSTRSPGCRCFSAGPGTPSACCRSRRRRRQGCRRPPTTTPMQ
jgi:hypothetical protein